jgi:hypothetical protein
MPELGESDDDLVEKDRRCLAEAGRRFPYLNGGENGQHRAG